MTEVWSLFVILKAMKSFRIIILFLAVLGNVGMAGAQELFKSTRVTSPAPTIGAQPVYSAPAPTQLQRESVTSPARPSVRTFRFTITNPSFAPISVMIEGKTYVVARGRQTITIESNNPLSYFLERSIAVVRGGKTIAVGVRPTAGTLGQSPLYIWVKGEKMPSIFKNLLLFVNSSAFRGELSVYADRITKASVLSAVEQVKIVEQTRISIANNLTVSRATKNVADDVFLRSSNTLLGNVIPVLCFVGQSLLNTTLNNCNELNGDIFEPPPCMPTLVTQTSFKSFLINSAMAQGDISEPNNFLNEGKNGENLTDFQKNTKEQWKKWRETDDGRRAYEWDGWDCDNRAFSFLEFLRNAGFKNPSYTNVRTGSATSHQIVDAEFNGEKIYIEPENGKFYMNTVIDDPERKATHITNFKKAKEEHDKEQNREKGAAKTRADNIKRFVDDDIKDNNGKQKHQFEYIPNKTENSYTGWDLVTSDLN